MCVSGRLAFRGGSDYAVVDAKHNTISLAGPQLWSVITLKAQIGTYIGLVSL